MSTDYDEDCATTAREPWRARPLTLWPWGARANPEREPTGMDESEGRLGNGSWEYFRMATGCGSISRLKPSVLTTPAREIETLLENRPSLCPGTWSWSVQTQLVNENFWYKTRQSSTVANGRRPWIFGQFGFSVRIARREMNFGRLT